MPEQIIMLNPAGASRETRAIRRSTFNVYQERFMSQWVEIKGTGVQGPVVARKQLEAGLVLGVDVNGEGGIYYVSPDQVVKVPTPTKDKK